MFGAGEPGTAAGRVGNTTTRLYRVSGIPIVQGIGVKNRRCLKAAILTSEKRQRDRVPSVADKEHACDNCALQFRSEYVSDSPCVKVGGRHGAENDRKPCLACSKRMRVGVTEETRPPKSLFRLDEATAGRTMRYK